MAGIKAQKYITGTTTKNDQGYKKNLKKNKLCCKDYKVNYTIT